MSLFSINALTYVYAYRPSIPFGIYLLRKSQPLKHSTVIETEETLRAIWVVDISNRHANNSRFLLSLDTEI